MCDLFKIIQYHCDLENQGRRKTGANMKMKDKKHLTDV